MIKIKANSISHNLVQVKPLGPISSIKLYYADYKYEDLLEVRKKKIEKIMNNINKKEVINLFFYLFSKSDNLCSIPAIINNISSL